MNRAKSILVIVLLSVAIIATASLSVMAYRTLGETRKTLADFDVTIKGGAKDAHSLSQGIEYTVSMGGAQLTSTLTDIRRTVEIAGGVLNVTRQIERDNRKDIQAANAQTLTTLQHVDGLVVSFDASQKQASRAIQDTSAALLPVMDQTRRDLAALEPAIGQITPLLQQSTEIAGNLNKTTADVQFEAHKLIFPPPRPWWDRYIFDPLRIAAHVVTFSVNH